MQKSSGYGIGNLTELEWRISAGFRAAVADRFSAYGVCEGLFRPTDDADTAAAGKRYSSA